MFLKDAASTWTKKACEFPVGFAQVREDPLLDLDLINKLNINNVNAIMIASGGCTAALLATHKAMGELTIIDANQAQLALTQLKLSLIENHDSDERLAILGHSALSPKERQQWIKSTLSALNYSSECLGSLQEVSELGLDYIGRYEFLFKALQTCISPFREQLLNNINQSAVCSETLIDNLRNAFSKVMDLSNLVALYGEEATQNPMMPFWMHFFQQTTGALQSSLSAHNPFLSQMLLGEFCQQPYEWIKQPKQQIKAKLIFEQLTLKDALEKKSDYYHFVHLSNALDWLTLQEASQLLEVVEQSMVKGGVFILRQLNSSLDIPSLSSPNIQWQAIEGEDLLNQDRSFFYRRLLIGTKK